MNKTELIAAVAEKAGLTKKDVEKAVAALLETVKGEVAKKGKVQLIGFGTFEARTRNARTGKNPRTNEPSKFRQQPFPLSKLVKLSKTLLTLLLQKNTKNNLGFQECRAKQPGIFV